MLSYSCRRAKLKRDERLPYHNGVEDGCGERSSVSSTISFEVSVPTGYQQTPLWHIVYEAGRAISMRVGGGEATPASLVVVEYYS